MAWYDIFLKTPKTVAATPMPVVLHLEEIDQNILRFRRALEQDEKGGARVAELNKNLAYWQAMRNLAVLGE
jgi:hypothetical protein